jgi:hypothetical protein
VRAVHGCKLNLRPDTFINPGRVLHVSSLPDLRMWPLNVDRLAVRLCSSPMSASTELKQGSLAGAASLLAVFGLSVCWLVGGRAGRGSGGRTRQSVVELGEKRPTR